MEYLKNNEDNINDQFIFEILNNKLFTSEFIAGIAGDSVLTDEERKMFDKLLDESGSDIYVKILFYITHQLFSKDEAVKLWDEILKHKYALSKTLNRNVEITIATLDYLTHVKNKIENPKLVNGSFIGRLVELSSSDGLTKLYNRSYLFMRLKEELNRYKRYKTSFSFIIMDIDDFKKINDQFGHQKGDEVLSRLGIVLNNSRRDLDICARYGGEEFAMILPHTSGKEAIMLSERLRDSVRDFFCNDIPITISLGVSNCPQSSEIMNDLIAKADKALYESKKNGKNKVTFM